MSSAAGPMNTSIANIFQDLLPQSNFQDTSTANGAMAPAMVAPPPEGGQRFTSISWTQMLHDLANNSTAPPINADYHQGGLVPPPAMRLPHHADKALQGHFQPVHNAAPYQHARQNAAHGSDASLAHQDAGWPPHERAAVPAASREEEEAEEPQHTASGRRVRRRRERRDEEDEDWEVDTEDDAEPEEKKDARQRLVRDAVQIKEPKVNVRSHQPLMLAPTSRARQCTCGHGFALGLTGCECFGLLHRACALLRACCTLADVAIVVVHNPSSWWLTCAHAQIQYLRHLPGILAEVLYGILCTIVLVLKCACFCTCAPCGSVQRKCAQTCARMNHAAIRIASSLPSNASKLLPHSTLRTL